MAIDISKLLKSGTTKMADISDLDLSRAKSNISLGTSYLSQALKPRPIETKTELWGNLGTALLGGLLRSSGQADIRKINDQQKQRMNLFKTDIIADTTLPSSFRNMVKNAPASMMPKIIDGLMKFKLQKKPENFEQLRADLMKIAPPEHTELIRNASPTFLKAYNDKSISNLFDKKKTELPWTPLTPELKNKLGLPKELEGAVKIDSTGKLFDWKHWTSGNPPDQWVVLTKEQAKKAKLANWETRTYKRNTSNGDIKELGKMSISQKVSRETSVQKEYGKTMTNVLEGGRQSRQLVAKLEQFKMLLTSTKTGRWENVKKWGGQWLNPLLKNIGLPHIANLGEMEAMDSIGTELALVQVQKTKGAISEREMIWFMASMPSLKTSVEGNLIIIEFVKNIQMRNIAKAKAMQEYLGKEIKDSTGKVIKKRDEVNHTWFKELEKIHKKHPIINKAALSGIGKMTKEALKNNPYLMTIRNIARTYPKNKDVRFVGEINGRPTFKVYLGNGKTKDFSFAK